ncbi:RNA binding domain-containing protein [Massariosphaeria phaeospora]|uniref:RNA binding domain-containing protein n=1 Tax=Massariosphaeria phaeospora TaxID=100035 RepID=A0A7C8MEB5_9PLEO|nr:RNA binding domain-containing protein [Massariosphaeria phaeospora]
MFLLRRSAARAISTPSRAILCKPRSINTIAPTAFRFRQQQWAVPALARRFVTDEAAKAESSAESFAQTATEAPIEENLTPAQEAVQAEPTDADATVGADALNAAAHIETKPSGNRTVNSSAEPNNTVYVGNLYYEVTEEQLKRVFSRFGSIKSIKVLFDNRGLSRGFGYIEFENINDAKAAVENLDMQVFEGRNLVVQFTKPKATSTFKTGAGANTPSAPSKTLFIGNMSFEMSDKDLNDLFRDIRNVMDVRVAIDRRTGQPRGFAHADFIDIASAMRAKEVLEEKVIYGRQLRIDYSKSGTRTEGSRSEGSRSGGPPRRDE